MANSLLTSMEEKNLKSLALIALKAGLDSDEFSNCVIDAWKNRKWWKNGKSKREDLVVIFRKETAFFLFTIGDKVLGQFSLPTRILRNEVYLRRYLEYSIRRIQNPYKRLT